MRNVQYQGVRERVLGRGGGEFGAVLFEHVVYMYVQYVLFSASAHEVRVRESGPSSPPLCGGSGAEEGAIHLMLSRVVGLHINQILIQPICIFMLASSSSRFFTFFQLFLSFIFIPIRQTYAATT